MGTLIAPRTATITLYWRPTPRVYDGRTSLLTTLEDQKRLRAFIFSDDVARARIDEDAEFAFGIDYFSVAFPEGFPEGAILQSLLDLVLDSVRPRISGFTARFQHLCPLTTSQDFERAKKKAATTILGPLVNDVSINDCAILVDGASSDGRARFKAEFGIVDSSEAAFRLTEEVGRISSGGETRVSPADTLMKNLPDIALYVDSYWRQSAPVRESGGNALYRRAKDFREYADNLANVLLARVDGTPEDEGVAP